MQVPMQKRKIILIKVFDAMREFYSTKFTLEKIKELAINSEYDIYQNSRSEFEYDDKITGLLKQLIGEKRKDISYIKEPSFNNFVPEKFSYNYFHNNPNTLNYSGNSHPTGITGGNINSINNSTSIGYASNPNSYPIRSNSYNNKSNLSYNRGFNNNINVNYNNVINEYNNHKNSYNKYNNVNSNTNISINSDKNNHMNISNIYNNINNTSNPNINNHMNINNLNNNHNITSNHTNMNNISNHMNINNLNNNHNINIIKNNNIPNNISINNNKNNNICMNDINRVNFKTSINN
ncbi:hypothetical protein H311_02718, partial [Anncaliia algerae PRA109]